MTEHGGKRKGSGAKTIEGKEYKIKLNKDLNNEIRENFPEEKTIPKKARKAMEEGVRARTQIMEIDQVDMEIYSGQGGKVSFTKINGIKNTQSNMIDSDFRYYCSSIKYYKQVGIFEIQIPMNDYITEWVKDRKDELEFLKRFKMKDYMYYIKNEQQSLINPELEETKLEELRRLSSKFTREFNFKYMETIIVYAELIEKIDRVINEYGQKRWLEENYVHELKEYIRERVSSEQQDNYIKYNEILDLIKEDIRAKNKRVWHDISVKNGRVRTEAKTKETFQEKLEFLNRRLREVLEIENEMIDKEKIEKSMKNDIEVIKKKINECTRIIESENAEIKRLKKDQNSRFEWNKILDKNEIEFIEKNGEVLKEEDNVFLIIKKIEKKLREESKAHKIELPQEIKEKYREICFEYLKEKYNIEGEEYNAGIAETIYKRSLDNIENEDFGLIDKEKMIKEVSVVYPKAKFEDIIEYIEKISRLMEYGLNSICPIIDEHQDKINNFNENISFCRELIVRVEDKIIRKHIEKVKIDGEWPNDRQIIGGRYIIREEEDIIEEKELRMIGKIKRDKEKLMDIDEKIRMKYKSMVKEWKEEIDNKLNEVSLKLESFDELKDEVVTLEIKPNSYITSR